MEAPAPQSIAFAIYGPIARDDLPGLCARVCALLGDSAAGVAFVDVAGIEPDAVCVDALARLQLAAKGYGCLVRLRNATPALRELVAFMGLADVLVE
jgi:ABC-type transporter Mla MlaB component